MPVKGLISAEFSRSFWLLLLIYLLAACAAPPPAAEQQAVLIDSTPGPATSTPAATATIVAPASTANLSELTRAEAERALIDAVRVDDVPLVSALLQAGANANASGASGPAVMIASTRGNVAMVDLLLEYGASLDVSNNVGQQPLTAAVAFERADMVAHLAALGIDLDAAGGEALATPPLVLAAQENSAEIITLLLDLGADIDARDRNGDSALIVAARLGNTEAARILLTARPNLQFVGFGGQTALGAAQAGEHATLINMLQAANAPATLTDSSGLAPYWPTNGWRSATPEQLGLDGDQLRSMMTEIETRKLAVTGVVISKNGYIVAERYFKGNNQTTLNPIYSITKSVVSTLVGIGLDDGAFDGLDTPLSDLLKRNIADADVANVSLENLLTMQTGIPYDDGPVEFNRLYSSQDWGNQMLLRGVEEPAGTRFNYCSGCTHLLALGILDNTGLDAEAFAQARLFAPLGIDAYRWERTPTTQLPIGGWGMEMSTRDLAKLGYLYLNRGVWDGKQLVSAEYIDRAMTGFAETEDRISQYGYQWWVYPERNAAVARGYGGQVIYVAPDDGLVIAFSSNIVEPDYPLYDLIETYVYE